MGLITGGSKTTSGKKTKLVQVEEYDGKFNIKEVSYLLYMIENMAHDGKNLEQALSCKTILKDSLDKLTQYKE